MTNPQEDARPEDNVNDKKFKSLGEINIAYENGELDDEAYDYYVAKHRKGAHENPHNETPQELEDQLSTKNYLEEIEKPRFSEEDIISASESYKEVFAERERVEESVLETLKEQIEMTLENYRASIEEGQRIVSRFREEQSHFIEEYIESEIGIIELNAIIRENENLEQELEGLRIGILEYDENLDPFSRQVDTFTTLTDISAIHARVQYRISKLYDIREVIQQVKKMRDDLFSDLEDYDE